MSVTSVQIVGFAMLRYTAGRLGYPWISRPHERGKKDPLDRARGLPPGAGRRLRIAEGLCQ